MIVISNRITSIFDFRSSGLSKVKADIAGVDGAWNKAKTGFRSATAEFKASRGAQLAAVGAIGAVAAKAITAASDLEESVNAVTVSYGENAEAVLAIGENAAESFGMSKTQFNAFAVQFSSFAKTVAEEQGRSVADVLEEITTRVADVASVMNLDLGTAAQLFQSTMAGSSEVARQYGYDVSAATVEQKLLAEGLVESKGAITETDKVLGRYLVLMGETSDAQGDFANTSDSLANQTRTLQARLNDLSADIGRELVPAAEKAVDKVNDLAEALYLVKDAAQESWDVLPGWLQRTISDVANAPEVLWSELEAGWDRTWGNGETAVTAWARTVAREMGYAADNSGESARRWRAELTELQESQEKNTSALDAYARQAGRAENAARNLAWANRDLAGQVDDATNEVDDFDSELNNLLGSLGLLLKTIDADEQLADLGQRLTDAGSGAALTSREIVELRRDVAEYGGEVAGLPGSVLTEIDAMIDEGAYAEAKRRLDILTAARFTPIAPFVAATGSKAGANANSSINVGAEGGIVTRPTMALIGEAGPEAVVPLNKAPGASPLPSDLGSRSGGNTYHIEVKTGMGADGYDVGRQIVDAIKRFERTNGTSWRS